MAAPAGASCAEVAEDLDVVVCGLHGEICRVTAPASWTVFTLKVAIEKSSGVSRFQQKLYAEGTFLKGAFAISSLLDSPAYSEGCLTLILMKRPEDVTAWFKKLILSNNDSILTAELLAEMRSGGVEEAEAILAAVEMNSANFMEASDALKADRDFVLDAIRRAPSVESNLLKFVHDKLRADREVVLTAMKENMGSYVHASSELKTDPQVLAMASQAVSESTRLSGEIAAAMNAEFAKAPSEVKANRDLVLMVVKASGLLLAYAADNLRADEEVVLEAVRQHGYALRHASKELRANHAVVCAAVKQNGFALQFADAGFHSNRDVVRAAVERHGGALRFAVEELRADQEIAGAAVREHGDALQYASQDLRNDRATVLASLECWGRALQHASELLRDDFDIAMAAVQCDGTALHHVSRTLAANKKLVLAAVAQCHHASQYADDSLHNDEDVLNLVVEGMRREQRERVSGRAVTTT